MEEAYVNYPDPPVWEHSKQRLLNAQFLTQVRLSISCLNSSIYRQFIKCFCKINRALKPKTALVVVTDDEGYGKSVIKEFEGLTNM